MDYSPASFVNFFSAQDLRMEANGRMRLMLPLQLFRDGRCRQAKCDAAMPRRLPRRAIPCRSSSSIDDRAPEVCFSDTSVQGLLQFTETDFRARRNCFREEGVVRIAPRLRHEHASLCLALFPGLGAFLPVSTVSTVGDDRTDTERSTVGKIVMLGHHADDADANSADLAGRDRRFRTFHYPCDLSTARSVLKRAFCSSLSRS